MSTRAVRDGEHYVVNGAKTFISNGRGADLIILAVKTDPDAGRRGISLLVVESAAPRLRAGAEASTRWASRPRTSGELYFTDVAVPAENLLGEENHGFEYMTSNLAQERLSIAINSQAAATTALELSFAEFAGGNGATPQNVKFELAAVRRRGRGRPVADRPRADANEAGTLSPADAAAAKLFCTELQGRVADRCLQLHGAAGYERAERGSPAPTRTRG